MIGPRFSTALGTSTRVLDEEAGRASEATSRRAILRGGEADRDAPPLVLATACGREEIAENAPDVFGRVSSENTSVMVDCTKVTRRADEVE